MADQIKENYLDTKIIIMTGICQEDVESILVTDIPVEAARDGQAIEPDHIYVIPPDKEIKANDGLVLVQSETSADYDGMPRSAIATGMADIILPPEEMPRRLTQYFSLHPVTSTETPLAKSNQRTWLYKIFGILRSQIGHDFSQYKLNTLLRRINRRMGLNQIQDHDKKWKIFRRIEIPQELRQQIEFPSGPSTTDVALANGKLIPAEEPKINLSLLPQKAILDQFAPKELAGRFLVVFEDVESPPASGPRIDDQASREQESARIAALERELQNTRESYQTTIEALESSKEELQSLKEELQTVNAELQSADGYRQRRLCRVDEAARGKR